MIRRSIFVAFSFAVAALSQSQDYTLQFMGLSQTMSALGPLRINDNGQVAGQVMFQSTGIHAFRWINGITEDLGSLGSLPTYQSGAYDINNSGVVVGQSQIEQANATRGFVYGSSMTPVMPLDGRDTYLTGINNSGVYVGVATKLINTSNWQIPAWLKNGTFTRLSLLNNQTEGVAHAINDSNVIVGVSGASDLRSHAVRWVNEQIQDLGYLSGYTEARAIDIDSSGRILVQQNNSQGNGAATLWTNGSYENLGAFGAVTMNNAGYVVGSRFVNGVSQGIVRRPDGQIINLNELAAQHGLSNFSPGDINNLGQIVGTGNRTSDNTTQYIILNPVPEPGTMVALGLGSAALMRLRRRKRVS